MKIAKGLHPKNLHSEKYDFEKLVSSFPQLGEFVKPNQYNDLSIDFGDPRAVLALNQSLLKEFYQVENWNIPKGNLCPPIPGRVDYIHYVADLLAEANGGVVPVGTNVKGLDIGTGASCIYAILGNSVYGWRFVGTDTDSNAVTQAKKNIELKSTLQKNIKIRFQKNQNSPLKDMIKSDEKFDFTICNPPFYSSLEEANLAADQKIRNLNQNKEKKGHFVAQNRRPDNFGGQQSELWTAGGELAFINQMIDESCDFSSRVGWFTTLVSNKEHLMPLNEKLQQMKNVESRTIEMEHGKKKSHILAWRFANKEK
ncbi:MAG: 23S rRNA (adenine(1618)-N(6))-methyltransferase RlmF [Bdellovibrio sp. CG12_big_fil_rev_8_21_14_0_65_39_13]|nr:MAG: 23S rRNA (adenine(1618)-N(6))-methyltransferase RlmF [Bdellovibrio sp. CG22_combo_CG10-13_8_21_14_all_39_27]PIQ60349.1 MAG: 23S rRNA (adenine(1618)-N(6))-methyltransferase RlmF [Bdellovibrio sp. CG12_big_fil_rev_8_21_14_0_65_39_13]PIR35042.1 MAG: 23S rRNA (adenine(1618)-N(6))-methyltransferase RlmF [Bdellovibrio sp. CG11_big_fil_rev_8_21_14_0_20_39_38]